MRFAPKPEKRDPLAEAFGGSRPSSQMDPGRRCGHSEMTRWPRRAAERDSRAVCGQSVLSTAVPSRGSSSVKSRALAAK